MSSQKPTGSQTGEGVDFSNFMNKQTPRNPAINESKIQELPRGIKISKRAKIFIGILIALAVIQAIIIYLSWNPKPEETLPQVILKHGQPQ